MYVDTMNARQMREEFSADARQLMGRMAWMMHGEYKKAMRRDRWPYVRTFKFEPTKRGNVYYCLIKSDNKHDARKKGMAVKIYGIMQMEKGIALVDDIDYVLGNKAKDVANDKVIDVPLHLYLPHVFARYRERFGLMDGYSDIYAQFIERNMMYQAVSSHKAEGIHGEMYDAVSIMNDGQLYGSLDDFSDDEPSRIVFKTFLTADMLNKKQRNIVNSIASIHLCIDYDELKKDVKNNKIYRKANKR